MNQLQCATGLTRVVNIFGAHRFLEPVLAALMEVQERSSHAGDPARDMRDGLRVNCVTDVTVRAARVARQGSNSMFRAAFRRRSTNHPCERPSSSTRRLSEHSIQHPNL